MSAGTDTLWTVPVASAPTAVISKDAFAAMKLVPLGTLMLAPSSVYEFVRTATYPVAALV
jgi:hypothetical protein